ncbi:MAG: hypothetical protein RLZZ511_4245 [Cyanobacteriota bacterium]|jgi:nitric oxide reductase subunit B
MTSPPINIEVLDTTKPRRRAFILPAWLVLICIVTFTVLIGAGAAIGKNAPPIPAAIVSAQHEIVLTQANIQNGQETYLGRGGQHIGSIWGRGSYLAPDWTADVLHRWGLATAGIISQNRPQFSEADLQALSAPDRARLQAQVNEEFKTNRYDPQSAELTLTSAQAQGLTQVFQDYRWPLRFFPRNLFLELGRCRCVWLPD